jgi:hypothetical protein
MKNTQNNLRLRWKKAPNETGLRRITQGPRSSWLTDGSLRYACVSALRKNHEQWYWVAGLDSDVPLKNTCQESPLSLLDAKKAAMAYVKHHLKSKE